MRFAVVLIFVFSLAGLALGAPPPRFRPKVLKEGEVVSIQPSIWGDQTDWPHPAVVLHTNGQTVTLAQLTHSPVKGQIVIETKFVAPSWKNPDRRVSYLVLNTPEIKNIHDPSIQHKIGAVLGTIPANELQNIRHERNVKFAIAAARVQAAGVQAAAKAKDRNKGLGHHF
ncbi:hypothetical protein JOM56_014979 [Amanita muscaria]